MRSIITVIAVALSVSAANASIYETNVLKNPGFEDGLNQWTTDHGTIRTGSPAPHGGGKYLMGSTDGSATSYTYQTVDLIDLGIPVSVIDSGNLDVHFGGYQSGYSTQADRGRIELTFNLAGGSSAGPILLDWVSTNDTWVLKEAALDIPVSTRSVEFGFRSERFDQNNNDGYLDDAFLEVIPEPGTLSLLALGTALLIRRRRRREA